LAAQTRREQLPEDPEGPSLRKFSLIEAARLERDGAQRRLELAKLELRDFFTAHPHGMRDLERKWLALEQELDSANRRYMECAYQLRQLEAQQ